MPYDSRTFHIATEAGVLLTDGLGHPLDGPLDVHTNLTWAGFATATLRSQIEPLLIEFFRDRGGRG